MAVGRSIADEAVGDYGKKLRGIMRSMKNREQKMTWRRRVDKKKNIYHEAVAIIRDTGHDTNYFGQYYKKPLAIKHLTRRPVIVVATQFYYLSSVRIPGGIIAVCTGDDPRATFTYKRVISSCPLHNIQL